MNPRWLLISTGIAMVGVLAGVAAFVLARLMLGATFTSLTVGFGAVVIVDVALVLIFYKRLTTPPPPRE